jgi:hypothetical protein
MHFGTSPESSPSATTRRLRRAGGKHSTRRAPRARRPVSFSSRGRRGVKMNPKTIAEIERPRHQLSDTTTTPPATTNTEEVIAAYTSPSSRATPQRTHPGNETRPLCRRRDYAPSAEAWRRALPKTQGDDRARIRSNQAQPAHQPVPAARQTSRTLRMATDHHHAQPTQAPQAPDSRRSDLNAALAAAPSPPPAKATRAQSRRSPPQTGITPPVSTICATPTTTSGCAARRADHARSRG